MEVPCLHTCVYMYPGFHLEGGRCGILPPSPKIKDKIRASTCTIMSCNYHRCTMDRCTTMLAHYNPLLVSNEIEIITKKEGDKNYMGVLMHVKLPPQKNS